MTNDRAECIAIAALTVLVLLSVLALGLATVYARMP